MHRSWKRGWIEGWEPGGGREEEKEGSPPLPVPPPLIEEEQAAFDEDAPSAWGSFMTKFRLRNSGLELAPHVSVLTTY